MTTVMAFGTFDLLHPGHINFLKQAKKHGDYLIVIIARDRTAKQVKGKSPTDNERARLKAVRGLNLADKTVLGDKGLNKYGVIKKHRPDTICLGYDQVTFTDKLEEKIKDFKLKTKIIRLKAFKPEKYKTSIIKHEKK
jgi:FAD synthetase